MFGCGVCMIVFLSSPQKFLERQGWDGSRVIGVIDTCLSCEEGGTDWIRGEVWDWGENLFKEDEDGVRGVWDREGSVGWFVLRGGWVETNNTQITHIMYYLI